jgi:hypothetical protein
MSEAVGNACPQGAGGGRCFNPRLQPDRTMNRRKSSVYTVRLDFLYLALILVLLAVRVGIDQAFDSETEAAVLAQPLFWFLCAVVSFPFGIFGLRIRCGLRLQIRFLLIAVIYFSVTLLLDRLGIPALPVFVIMVILAVFSMRFWHGYVSRVLSYRAFRVTRPTPMVDMSEN